MIKTIIFDIGGVLVGYDWNAYLLRELGGDEELVDRLRDCVFGHGNWDEVDRGVLTDEQIIERFEKTAPDLKDTIHWFWENLGGALWQFDFAKDWIKDLKSRGYQVLFLSNWSEHVRKCTPKQMDFLELMDGGVFSYEVNLIKPDHAIYKEIIKKYDLNPAECVFLDDRADNANAARECGMHAVQVKEHEETVRELEKLLKDLDEKRDRK